MNKGRKLSLSPLVQALCMAPMMLLVTPGVSAVTTVEGTLDIDSTTPLDNYRLSENALHLVHAAAGDASFSLVNGPVDLGAFSYELVQRGNDWFLDGTRKVISPGTASVLALFNTAPTVWYGELTTLRSRMIEPAKVISPLSANAVLLARPKAMARRVFFIF